MDVEFPYRLVDHWVPRNIIRFDRVAPSFFDAPARWRPKRRAKPDQPRPAAPRFNEALWRRTLGVMLAALKPFNDAWQCMQTSIHPLLLELELR